MKMKKITQAEAGLEALLDGSQGGLVSCSSRCAAVSVVRVERGPGWRVSSCLAARDDGLLPSTAPRQKSMLFLTIYLHHL
jgi:hypothetical protein